MLFNDFAAAHGVLVRDTYPSDKIKRCATTLHPRSKNGAYFFDGERGWVFAWDGDAQVQWWSDENAKPWTDEDKAEFKRRQQQAREERSLLHSEVAKKAQSILNSCETVPHEYLIEKGFPDELGFVAAGSLYIPMRNVVTNALQGLQVISCRPDRTKRMLTGMMAKNAVFRFGSKVAEKAILCEGYATGLSIHKAVTQLRLNASVVVCFSANNMVAVSSQIKSGVFVFADNDQSCTGELSAKMIDRPYTMSDAQGEDANDLMQRAGILAVCKKVMELVSKQ